MMTQLKNQTANDDLVMMCVVVIIDISEQAWWYWVQCDDMTTLVENPNDNSHSHTTGSTTQTGMPIKLALLMNCFHGEH